MKVRIPELSLVVLIGPSGSGKSTFARRHFKATEVLSSDYCRALVSDDENDQSATKDAFEVLHLIASKRLAAGRLTVIDATNVQPDARRPLINLARQYHCLPVALVFDLPERVCHERNARRADRNFGPHVVRNQRSQLHRSMRDLRREGFRHIYQFDTPEEVDSAVVTREPLWNNRKSDTGPFDFIGDVHGCFDELCELLEKLGYSVTRSEPGWTVTPPAGRKLLFVGDLVDRGPRTPDVLRLVMGMVAAGTALCVPGNHDDKLLRYLQGKRVQIKHGLEKTVEQMGAEPPWFHEEVAKFIDGLVSHYVLDGGRLVVAHAGMKESMQGRGSGAVREFALYGETTGETDEFGLPIRYNWAADYKGKATVVYGHTPVMQAEWLNGTINIDTGCVFGGALTALRWPERELVSVPAKEAYVQPGRPIRHSMREEAPPGSPTSVTGDVLDLDDVLGRRAVETRLRGRLTVQEGEAAAALEVMSRFATDPRWLVYLPPTMSPSETSREPGLLEHPAEAFAYYRSNGIDRVICEEKHMGSRTVVVVCRNEEAVRRQFFGMADAGLGACYTRTGRRFFNAPALESELLTRLSQAFETSGLWDELKTDWAVLDCELMPWSAKAQELLRRQYAAVGAAARASLGETVPIIEQALARPDQEGSGVLSELLQRMTRRRESTSQFVEAYRRYCWPVQSIADYRLAPFHLLATEGAVHTDKPHLWHMDIIGRLCRGGNDAGASALFHVTPFREVDLRDPAGEAAVTAWWEELTGRGGEGMVIKPADFIASGTKGLVQPALKCRGREYLRLIYGPDYDAPENLERLRKRGLGAKRSLALREFALGIEGLERFVRREPLRRVHECVFAVLALESEPVDPRL